MEILLKIVHVFASISLVLVVLLQSGRGGGMGAAFGGASGQIFGGRGASSFLSRVTTGAAVVFFYTSLTLSMMSSRHRSVVLKSRALPAHAAPAAGQSGASSPDHEAIDDGQQDDAAGGHLEGAKAPSQAGPAAPKRPNDPEATPPGVPSGH